MGAGALVQALVVVLAVVILATTGLFARKMTRQAVRRRQARRRAALAELVGDLVMGTRQIPRRLLRRRRDPLLCEVVLEHLRFLRGSERERLLVLTRASGMIDWLRADLTGFGRRRRVRAAQALVEVADASTIPLLLSLLTDSDEDVGVHAALAIAAIGDAQAVPNLLACMERSSEWAALRIADGLGRLGPQAVPELCAHLGSGGRYRPVVARILGSIGDRSAEPALLAVLDTPDTELRVRATAALGRCGGPASTPRLMALLGDGAWEVRAQAATALGQVLEPAAVPYLAHALRDPAWWVRQNAAMSLARIPGGTEALVAEIDGDDPYARDAAAAALLVTGAADRAVGDLEADEPEVRARSEDLVRHLLDAGKAEYLRAVGMADREVRSLRVIPGGRAR
ncbi:MAG: HEAT repeat domain-containing protein [Acidimicrobiia bacterium]|jgi:HEAT repeat protein